MPGQSSLDAQDLAVIDVRRVNGADLAALPQGKVDIFPRFPLAGKNFPPPAGGARKQVALKVLGGLFPPHTVAAFQPIPEHIPKTENLRQCAQAVISGLFPGLPPFHVPGQSSLDAHLQDNYLGSE